MRRWPTTIISAGERSFLSLTRSPLVLLVEPFVWRGAEHDCREVAFLIGPSWSPAPASVFCARSMSRLRIVFDHDSGIELEDENGEAIEVHPRLKDVLEADIDSSLR